MNWDAMIFLLKRRRKGVIDPDIHNEQHLRIFEAYIRGVGMTPRMVTNVETGENYRDGQTAAERLGVTRQDVNNCIHGRQKTVGGYHLVLATEFRRGLTRQFAEICRSNGTNPFEVFEEFRSL